LGYISVSANFFEMGRRLNLLAASLFFLFFPFIAKAAHPHVVQFVVHANEKTDVERLFTGANVDFTWNNVFVVSIWTSEPDSLIRSVTETLNANANILQVLVPPYSIEASTQKWIQYNIVWVLTLVFVFTGGCVCGGVLIFQCFDARRAIYSGHRRHALF
jgi:hypothetical protein